MINSGIYQIRNLVNGKIYVGSAVEFIRRKSSHFNELRRNIHHSIKLQRSYNKHGVENFVFEVLEYIEDHTKLIEREQHFIDILKPFYNICPTAGSSLGRKFSEETKQKISKSKKGVKPFLSEEVRKRKSDLMKDKSPGNKGIPMSEESKIKMINTKRNNGTLNHSEETKKKMSNSLLGNKRFSGKIPWNKGKKLKSSWNKGIPLSEETKAKMRATVKLKKEKLKNTEYGA